MMSGTALTNLVLSVCCNFSKKIGETKYKKINVLHHVTLIKVKFIHVENFCHSHRWHLPKSL